MQGTPACRNFHWRDPPTCQRGLEVLPELLKKINNLENENDSFLERVNMVSKENSNYIARVKELEDEADSYSEKVDHLLKENDTYRSREQFLIIALILSLLVVCITHIA